jgi:general secretion pathway protein E
MFNALYVNPIFWAISVALILVWARWVAWLSKDVLALSDQNELLWRGIGLGSLLVIILAWLLIPIWFAGLGVALAVMAGLFFWYNSVRAKTMGSSSNPLNSIRDMFSSMAEAHERSRATREIALQYLGKDGGSLPFIPVDSPLYGGMQYADQLIVQALERRADELEISPANDAYELRFFVDGIAFPQAAITRDMADPLIEAIKNRAGLNTEEHRKPQQGLFKTRDGDHHVVTWTVRSSGNTAGERLTMVADEHLRWNRKLEDLGMPAEQLQQVKEIVAAKRGVVLVATPKQHGRTNTLYALVRAHDAFTNAVHALEINPQAELEGVTVTRFDQRAAGASYARSLQSIFLKDPAIILSAQIPDAATAEALARFAEDEHRAYAGIPAQDSVQALEMWLQLVPNRQLAIRSIEAIISQRLVRLLCPSCKVPYQPDEATLKRLNLPLGRNFQCFKANTEGIVDAKGNRITCPDCDGIGYRGRTAIFEILRLDNDLRQALLAGTPSKQILVMARKKRMTMLIESGIKKFAQGLTSIQEVLRAVQGEKQSSSDKQAPANNPTTAA